MNEKQQLIIEQLLETQKQLDVEEPDYEGTQALMAEVRGNLGLLAGLVHELPDPGGTEAARQSKVERRVRRVTLLEIVAHIIEAEDTEDPAVALKSIRDRVEALLGRDMNAFGFGPLGPILVHHRDRIADLVERLGAKGRCIDGMEAEHVKEVERLKAEHETLVSEMKADERLRQEGLVAKYLEESDKLKADHAEEVKTLNDKNAAQRYEEAARAAEEMKAEHAAQLVAFYDRAVEEREKLKTEHAKEILDLTDKHADRINAHQAHRDQDEADAATAHAAEIEKLKFDHAAIFDAAEQRLVECEKALLSTQKARIEQVEAMQADIAKHQETEQAIADILVGVELLTAEAVSEKGLLGALESVSAPAAPEPVIET